MSFVKGFLRGMRTFGLNPGTIINTVLLSAVYIIGVGITSLIARISGKQFLATKKQQTKSYWTDLNLGKKDLDDYYRQH